MRLHPILALGLAATALAACTKSRVDPIPPADAVQAEEAAADEALALPMPPPPPPPVAMAPTSGIVVTGSRIASPKMGMEPGWMPPPPVGRDRFTAISENPFRVA